MTTPDIQWRRRLARKRSKAGRKGEGTERMDFSRFMTALGQTNAATHVLSPLFRDTLLAHQWKTLTSCLFNYANANIYK